MGTAVLRARRDAGAGLSLVTLEVSSAAAKAYVAPGQYVEVRTPLGAGFFVQGGALGEPTCELLVRNAGGASQHLMSAPLGAELEVSDPLGGGFPLERARGRELVVAVVGSALIAARPVLTARAEAGGLPTTHVYIGARTTAEVPLMDEVDAWSRAGADVVLCLSGHAPEAASPELPLARRAPGYVQDVVHGDVARAVRAGRSTLSEPPGVHVLKGRPIVFAAGPPSMLASMRDLPESVLEVVTNI